MKTLEIDLNVTNPTVLPAEEVQNLLQELMSVATKLFGENAAVGVTCRMMDNSAKG